MKPIRQVINNLTMRSHSNQCMIFWVRSSNSSNAELDNEFKGLFTMLQLKEGVLDIDFHLESLIPACLSGMLIGGTDPNCVAKQTTGQVSVSKLDVRSTQSHHLALFIHGQKLGLFLVKKSAQLHIFFHKFLNFGLFLDFLTL